jgi:stage II sporulation protein M
MVELREKLDDYIRNAFAVVSKARMYIILAAVIFFVSLAAGAVMHERLAVLINYLFAFVKNLKDKNTAGIILSVFQKNLIATLVIIITGIMFGVQKGLGVVTLMAAIVPHSIFELPAFFIAGGVAMRMGFMQFRREGREPARKRMVEGLQVLIFVVMPLLIIAAIIEGVNITLLR